MPILFLYNRITRITVFKHIHILTFLILKDKLHKIESAVFMLHVVLVIKYQQICIRDHDFVHAGEIVIQFDAIVAADVEVVDAFFKDKQVFRVNCVDRIVAVHQLYAAERSLVVEAVVENHSEGRQILFVRCPQPHVPLDLRL